MGLANSFFGDFKSGKKLEDLATRYPIKVDKIKVTQEEELKKEIAEVVFKLNISEVSNPVSVDGKYYVFKLDNITPSKYLLLSEVQDKIHSYIFERKMQQELTKWLDELKKQSYIKIMQS
jgi:parvulin-like peptidyl-prolyl isomerase